MTSQLNNSIIADSIQCYSIQAVTGSIARATVQQRGAVMMPAILGQGVQTVDVAFDIPFSSTPNVVQSLEIPVGPITWGNTITQVQLITPTGFQAVGRNLGFSDSFLDGRISWIATL